MKISNATSTPGCASTLVALGVACINPLGVWSFYFVLLAGQIIVVGKEKSV